MTEKYKYEYKYKIYLHKTSTFSSAWKFVQLSRPTASPRAVCCLVISVFLPALVHDICLLTGLPEDDSVLAYIDDITSAFLLGGPICLARSLTLFRPTLLKAASGFRNRSACTSRAMVWPAASWVGNDEAVAQQLVDNLDDAAAAFDTIPLAGKHAAWDIFRSCLDPLAGHSRRTELPHARVRAAQRLHSQIRDVVARLTDLPSLPDGQKLIVPLPFEFAGLDMKDAVVFTDNLLDWFPFVQGIVLG